MRHLLAEEATVDLDDFGFIGPISRLAIITEKGEGEQSINVEVLQGATYVVSKHQYRSNCYSLWVPVVITVDDDQQSRYCSRCRG